MASIPCSKISSSLRRSIFASFDLSGGGAIFIRGRGWLRTVCEMFLALKEMRRAKVRFGLLIVAIGLLVFLILFQQSLQNSLLRGFTGALRSQSAPVLVYSTDGQRTLQASVLTPEARGTGQVRGRCRRGRADRAGHVHRHGR